jgi:hypothetical protein
MKRYLFNTLAIVAIPVMLKAVLIAVVLVYAAVEGVGYLLRG